MNKARDWILSLPVYTFYSMLLLFYPPDYRRKFGQEMFLTFQDMYREEMMEKGKASTGFWLEVIGDAFSSAVGQHLQMIQKQGVRKYSRETLNLNKYNIIGGILLLPAFGIFALDIVSRVLQGDIVHYNRALYAFLSHTPLYRTPILFSWVILFPLLAVLINLVPVINYFRRKHTVKISVLFIERNLISIAILGVGLFFLAIVKLHDFAPCMLHGLLKVGGSQMLKIISVCSKA
ncbi:MAG: hypothetical protein M1366_00730 [Patescibacteria group bacterium]|nr:hypothetical protein [Patescibacteria group bacterium]